MEVIYTNIINQVRDASGLEFRIFSEKSFRSKMRWTILQDR